MNMDRRTYLFLFFSAFALYCHSALAVVQMELAKNSETGGIVHIRNTGIAPSRSQYKCLDCSQSVYPVRGPVRAKHFRHAADSSCSGINGSTESVQHLKAKNKLKAILNHPKRLTVRVLNCGGVCQVNCYTDIRLAADEKAVIEYRMPDGGIADLAIVRPNTNATFPRVILEVFHTHKSCARREPWFEVSASDVNSATLKNDILVLKEQRDNISVYRGCNAFTLQDRIKLAGFHSHTLKLRDTFKDMIEETSKLNNDNHIKSNFHDRVRWFLSVPEQKRFFEYMSPGITMWCQRYLEDKTAMERAQRSIEDEGRCIQCERRFDNESWKILCRDCYSTRRRLIQYEEEIK